MDIRHLFLSAFRSLRWDIRNTLINISGLGTGLTVFILIVLYVNSQYSYNTHIAHSKELFRLERGFHGITNALEGPRFAPGIPEIKSFCRITSNPGSMFFRQANQSRPVRADINAVAADSSFLDMFEIDIIENTGAPLLQTPRSVIISSELAEKLFGNTSAVGQLVSMDNQDDLTVEAVFSPLPPTSTMEFDAVFSIDFLPLKYSNPDFLNNPGQWNYETYFRIDQEMIEAAERKIFNAIKNYYEESGTTSINQSLVVDLRPLREIYFSDIADNLHRHGDKHNTYIFTIIAGFVLLIAAINFINLATASAGKKSKGTGLKKILGASRGNLISEICAEGIIIILISIFLALTLSEILLPWYSRFVDTDLSINYSTLNLIVTLIGVPLVLGSLSALFPALFLSRVSPLSVMKKEWVSGKGGIRLRTFLTVFQFSISIFLITGTLIINKQLRFVNSYDPGYLTDNIIEVKLNNQVTGSFDVFKQACLSYPAVTGITRTNQAIYQARNVWSVYHGDNNFTWPFIAVDEDFVKVFGLDIKTGEDFSADMLQREKSVFLVNEAVISAFEVTDILDETINDHDIVGVVNNFHTASLKSDIRPVTIGLSPSTAGYFVYIKLDPGNQQESIEVISRVWGEHSPDYPFEYEYLTDRIENAYFSEKRFGELFTYFSFVSVLISCLGLFALSAFTAENRIKEISIRKVHGATTYSIGMLLSSGLTGKVIIANLIAWPAAWYFIKGWLENFAYRTEPGVWEFLAAALITQAIALATVSWHVYTTARKNPADMLKYE